MGRRRWGRAEEEEQLSLSPANFFNVQQKCLQGKLGPKGLLAKHKIAATNELTGDQCFADVSMAWSEEGLSFSFAIQAPIEASFHPQVEGGDAIELFIDTRDMKAAGFSTRFCHHFFFLPQEVDGTQQGEITRFRTDDRHPLCDPELLQCEVVPGRKQYRMDIFLPSACLVGYNPSEFTRFGFCYRISRYGGEPQYYTVRSNEFAIDQNPALWSSVRLA